MVEKKSRRRGESGNWWLNKAEYLHHSSKLLWFSEEIQNHFDDEDKDEIDLSDNFKWKEIKNHVFPMLAGLSLEVLLKGIIVTKDNGSLDNVDDHHKLINLIDDAGVKYIVKDHEEKLLETFTKYSIWAGKYPVDDVNIQDDIKDVFDVSDDWIDNEGLISQKKPNLVPNWDNYKALWDKFHTKFFSLKDTPDF